MSPDLYAKYDVPVPRYTSYPTVPFWCEHPTTEQWLDSIRVAAADADARWALYVHIPFCESLCTFCGCNTVITRDHGREATYVELLHKEWALYASRVPELRDRPLRQLHLGGGTPTFLSPAQLQALLAPLLREVAPQDDAFDASVEVDPRVTTSEHLERLRALGFTRVSMGVQDFDATVQRLVNRTQPFDVTARLVLAARALQFRSINFDLIYGLPQQTPESMARLAAQTIQLAPDRIALYSFARVPWIKPAQRLFKDDDLPEGADKRRLYEIARSGFLDAGYVEIGMDHFARPDDALAVAERSGELHRNFMGYTEFRTSILLGLGVSAISETPTCFHQNDKVYPVFERRVAGGEIPTFRGHLLTEADRRCREQITTFMTRFRVRLDAGQVEEASSRLAPMIEDGLVQIRGNELLLTREGRPFLRNAAVFFDQRLRAHQPDIPLFSRAI